MRLLSRGRTLDVPPEREQRGAPFAPDRAPAPIRSGRQFSARPFFFVGGILALLVAQADRLAKLGDSAVWWDEGYAIALARLPLLQAAYETAFDVHPPLHYWFLHFWIRLVGESEFAARYSSVLFAVLSVAVLAWVGRRLLGPAAGLIAAAALAVARIHVEWSQQMRMYTLVTALIALLIYFSARLCVQPTRRRWVGLIITGTVALYTLYVAGIALFACGLAAVIYGILTRPTWRVRGRWVAAWVGAAAAVTVLYAPWLVTLARAGRPAPIVLWTLDPVTYVVAYATVLPLGVSTYLDRYTLPVLAATALALGGFALLARSKAGRPVAWVALALLAIVPAVVYAMSLPNPLFFKPNLYVRYLLILLPAYDLLLAAAVVGLWRARPVLGALAGAFLLIASLWALADYYPSRIKVDDYASLVRFIGAHAQPGDEIVLYPDRDWPIFGYYNHTGLPLYGIGTADKLTPAAAGDLGARLLDEHASLWLVSIDGGRDSDPSGALARWLGAHTRQVADLTSDTRRVQLLTRDPGRTLAGWNSAPERRDDAALAPGIRLVGHDLAVSTISAGSTLDVAAYWQAAAKTTGRFAEVWLADERGTPVRARAWPLDLNAAGDWRIDYLLPIPAGLPAGRYSLLIGTRPAAGAEPPDTAHQIGSIQVVSNAPPIAGSAPPTETAQFGTSIALDRLQVTLDDRPVPGPASSPLELRRGETIGVDATWRALAATDHRYTLFAHLIGPTNPKTGNPVWSQVDAFPGNGTRPTDEWMPGQTIDDHLKLGIPPDAPAGAYQVEVGLYELPSGARLPVRAGASTSDHLIVATGTLGTP